MVWRTALGVLLVLVMAVPVALALTGLCAVVRPPTGRVHDDRLPVA